MPATAHVVKVSRIWEGWLAGRNRAAIAWEVLFDEPQYASSVVAKTASDGTTTVPAIGTAHPEDATLFASEPTATARGGPTLFQVVVEYARSSNTAEEREPTTSAWLWEWDGDERVEPVDIDAGGASILNSAGDPFDPPIAMTKSDPVAIGRKYITEAQRTTLGDLDAYRASVNDAAVTLDGISYAAGRCLLRSISLSAVTLDGVNHRLATVRIAIRDADPTDDAWLRVIADEGYRDINGVAFTDTDADGNVVKRSVPSKLDGTGEERTTGDAYQLKFVEFPATSWTPFSFA